MLVEREPGLERTRIRTAEPVAEGGRGGFLYEFGEGDPFGLDRPRPAVSVTGRIASPALQSAAPGALHLSSPGGTDWELLQLPTEGEGSGLIRLDALAWSPDGGELALLETLRMNPVSLERLQIRVRVLDLDMGAAREVSAVTTSPRGEEADLGRGLHSNYWTPDGAALTFTATAGPFGSDLFFPRRLAETPCCRSGQGQATGVSMGACHVCTEQGDLAALSNLGPCPCGPPGPRSAESRCAGR